MTRFSNTEKILALAVIPAVAGIYLYIFKDLTAVVGGDTPSYVNLDPSRPVAYGAFLNGVFKQGFGLNAIPPIQLALLLSCLWITAWVWTACTGRFALVFVWQGLTVANILLAESSIYLIPDAVSAAHIMLAFASIISITARYTRARLSVLLIVCAVSILIRPTNLMLIVGAAGLLFILPGVPRRERLIGLSTAAVVCLLALAVSPAFYFYRYGSAATSSPAARGLLQKTLFTAWAPDETATRCGGAVIEAATHDVVGYLQAAPQLTRSILEDKYSNYLRFSVIIPQLQDKLGLRSERDVNNTIACYVSARFKQNPFHFLERFARDYLRLGLYLVFVDQHQRAQYEAYVAAAPPPQPAASAKLGDQISDGFKRAGMMLPSDARTGDARALFDPPLARAALPLLLLRVFQALALVISAAILARFLLEIFGVARKRTDPVILWAALMLQLNTIATAVFEMPLPRYMTPLWPLSVAIVLLACAAAIPLVRAVLCRLWPPKLQSVHALQPR